MSATARGLGALDREGLQVSHDGLDSAQLADLLVAVKDGNDVAAHVVAQPAGALFPKVAPAVPIYTAFLRQMGFLGTAWTLSLAVMCGDELVVKVDRDKILVGAHPDLLPDKRKGSRVGPLPIDEVIVRMHCYRHPKTANKRCNCNRLALTALHAVALRTALLRSGS